MSIQLQQIEVIENHSRLNEKQKKIEESLSISIEDYKLKILCLQCGKEAEKIKCDQCIKENVNKIHVNLSDNFESVSISEKNSLEHGNYIEFSITEGNRELKAIINKKDLEGYNFDWKYYANPINEKSDLVDRMSSIDGFINDVRDIFNKNRFNSDYIESIK